jgi:hypothetical protein
MFYKFIELPNLTQLQSDVLAFVNSPEYALEPNESHSIRFADSWKHVQSVVDAVETVCPWKHVNYIAFTTTPARTFGTAPHVDSVSNDTEYPWALNIPIANWRQTYVNFYHAKKGITGVTDTHGQDMYQYPCTNFDKQDINLMETVCLNQPAFFNTREIHSPVNYTSASRNTISVRFHCDLRRHSFKLSWAIAKTIVPMSIACLVAIFTI